MALVKITPVEARVQWDRRADRPARVEWAGRALGVVGLARVRDELSAYPAAQGPRVTFLLETKDGGHASLIFDGRRRRWYVEAVDLAA